jgi:hypothetical protein
MNRTVGAIQSRKSLLKAKGNDTKPQLAFGGWHWSFRCPSYFDSVLCCCGAGGLKAKGEMTDGHGSESGLHKETAQ